MLQPRPRQEAYDAILNTLLRGLVGQDWLAVGTELLQGSDEACFAAMRRRAGVLGEVLVVLLALSLALSLALLLAVPALL